MNTNTFFIVALNKQKLTKTKTTLYESCVLRYLTPSWRSALKKLLEHISSCVRTGGHMVCFSFKFEFP